ncbi:MAG: hypothetical protein ACRD0E_01350 [Acidimicrobiales bacterium]
MLLSPEVARSIAAYRPRVVDESAARFAREATACARPPNLARAKALLFACSRLAAFGQTCGYELIPEVVLDPSVIERFIETAGRQMSDATRRTIRTSLRFASSAVLQEPGPVRLPRERSKAPYSAAEIDSYLALCDAQPTVSRRMRSTALISLGAGAGLMGVDLRSVRGSDVIERSGGVVVIVSGRRARVVPVQAVFHTRLVVSAAFARSGYVVGGRDPQRNNVTTPLTSSLAGGKDLPRLELGRLRATWLVGVARQIGLRDFMDAAGIICSQRLGDLIATLPGSTEPEVVSLLGGAS